MTPPHDLIDRIDTLMQRKRVFVANAPQTRAEPSVKAADEEDIPVLTEVVDISEVSGDAPHEAVHPSLDPLIDAVTLDFSLRLQERFATELPALINETVERLAIELQQSVHKMTEETLRDFVAQRRQLSLPLPEQAPGQGE